VVTNLFVAHRFKSLAKFRANASHSDRDMAIKAIFKVAAADILDFGGNEIWRHSPRQRAKVAASIQNLINMGDVIRVMAILCFQNGGCGLS